MYFEDRNQAGQLLGAALVERVHDAQALVLGLSYGGLLVAHEAAGVLGLAVDSFLAPHRGAPGRHRRLHHATLSDRTVIVVDDGAATGETVLRAIDELRREGVRRLLVGLPVAPPFTCAEIEPRVDELICLQRPSDFLAVGACYARFPTVTPAEAVHCLRAAPCEHPHAQANQAPSASLQTCAGSACDRLEGGLRAIGDALASRATDEAAARIDRWRVDLVHHLAWEEETLLPAYVRRAHALGSRIQAEHVSIHESLRSLADELALALAHRERHPDGALRDLLEALARKFSMHRNGELYGLCAVLDSVGAQLELPTEPA